MAVIPQTDPMEEPKCVHQSSPHSDRDRSLGSFCDAFMLDGLKVERERGIKINLPMRDFSTAENHFCATGLQGNRDF